MNHQQFRPQNSAHLEDEPTLTAAVEGTVDIGAAAGLGTAVSAERSRRTFYQSSLRGDGAGSPSKASTQLTVRDGQRYS